MIGELTKLEAPDPEGIARRDIVGNVPSTAAYAIVRALLALKPGVPPATVARLLADGRDETLGVRWHLVDEDGRPISLNLDGEKRLR